MAHFIWNPYLRPIPMTLKIIVNISSLPMLMMLGFYLFVDSFTEREEPIDTLFDLFSDQFNLIGRRISYSYSFKQSFYNLSIHSQSVRSPSRRYSISSATSSPSANGATSATMSMNGTSSWPSIDSGWV